MMRSIDSGGRDVHVEEGTMHAATEGSIRHSGQEETQRNLRQGAGNCSTMFLQHSHALNMRPSITTWIIQRVMLQHGLAMSELENGKGLKKRVLPVRQSSQQ